MSSSARWVAGLAALAAFVPPAYPQVSFGDPGYYEARYGAVVDVQLDDLLQNPESYQQRAVRTTGRLDIHPDDMRTYVLRGTLHGAAILSPVGEVRAEFESTAREWLGRMVEVSGVVQMLQAGASSPLSQGGATVAITFWAFIGPQARDDEKAGPSGAAVTLESLVGAQGRRDGQLVRVVGMFRGGNLYGDLPVRSRLRSDDWVIKDDVFAVWVTGRKPRGRGWQLDASLKRDTGKWIEVVGRPETRRGVTYIRATQVALTTPPSAAAKVEPPPPPPPRPKVPPVVVFALPLDGEAEVAADSRFTIQFSKDMDRASFDGRVRLRYAGATRPGDRAFDGLRLTYDDGRRALTVDPGDALRPNRVVELLLLAGIVDTDGLALVSRSGASMGETIEVLRYRTGY